MIKKLIVFSLCLWMPKLAFSQGGYPKLIVYNGDTLVALTRHQVDILNVTKINHDRYKEQLANMKRQQKDQEVLLVTKQVAVELLEKNGVDKDTIIKNKDLDIDAYKTEVERLEKKVKILTAQRAGLLVTIALLIAKLIFF